MTATPCTSGEPCGMVPGFRCLRHLHFPDPPDREHFSLEVGDDPDDLEALSLAWSPCWGPTRRRVPLGRVALRGTGCAASHPCVACMGRAVVAELRALERLEAGDWRECLELLEQLDGNARVDLDVGTLRMLLERLEERDE